MSAATLPWLDHYPPGVPAQARIDAYSGLAELLEHAFRKHAQRDACACMDSRLRFRDIDVLSQAFGAQVWPPIPTDTKAREAPAYGQTLWEYAPRSQVVLGYQNGSHHRVGGYLAAIERLMEVPA